VFALCVDGVLYLGKGFFVPIVFSFLVEYGIAGLAQFLWLRQGRELLPPPHRSVRALG